ncbi:MAG: TlpA family protein disulfide reductase, partial [bacterium]|nr:TlpA family protein disulfide reductase [bacterium]
KVVAELKRSKANSELIAAVESRMGARLTSEDEKSEVVQSKKSKKYDLTLRDEKGNEFSLDDFKGKVVYLDIWASWCGPCRKQFPHAKAMKQKLSNKEKKKVVFLYISIDNTETAWKKALEQYDLDGVHGFSPGGWGSEITKIFKVASIPRYLLFNKAGALEDHNATRPADRATLEKIRELIRN